MWRDNKAWQCPALAAKQLWNLISGEVFDQPIVDAIDNGHQSSLVQVAAHSGSDPWFVTVGVEAQVDADMCRRIMGGHINGFDAEGSQAHLFDHRVPLFQLFAHCPGERIYRACAFGSRGSDGRISDGQTHEGLNKSGSGFIRFIEDTPALYAEAIGQSLQHP